VKAIRTRTIWGAIFFLYFFLVTIPMAHAYVDPGTGSYIFQVLIGAVLGIAVAMKLWWRRLWGFVTRKPSAAKAAKTGTPPEQPE
jgi:cytochrome b561